MIEKKYLKKWVLRMPFYIIIIFILINIGLFGGSLLYSFVKWEWDFGAITAMYHWFANDFTYEIARIWFLIYIAIIFIVAFTNQVAEE